MPTKGSVQIDPQAILAVISDLVTRLVTAEAQIRELENELAKGQSPHDD